MHSPDDDGPTAEFVTAVHAGEAARVRQLLDAHPDVRARIDDSLPGFHFGGTAVLAAVHQKNLPLLDVLLAHGADINQKSRWWAGGFGVLDDAAAPLDALVARGAAVDIHAAARHGLMDRLRELIAGDADLVHARGGDGQTPLHAARTVEVAAFLLDHGADIDARDIDHESTPAQWMVDDRLEITRFLVGRGALTDILMAAASGDESLVRRHLDRDPGAVRAAVTPAWLPLKNPRAGGHIYNWSLERHATVHRVARKYGHEGIYRLLLERSPAGLRLAVALRLGDPATADALLAADRSLPSQFEPSERRMLVDAAQDNDAAAVARMLDAGWPADARGQEDATALHWAAFHGNAEAVRALLAHGARADVTESTHGGKALDWAEFGSQHSWHCRSGNYDAVVGLLRGAAA